MSKLKKALRKFLIILLIVGFPVCFDDYIFPALGLKLNAVDFEASEVEYAKLSNGFSSVMVTEAEDIETIITELNSCTLQGVPYKKIFSRSVHIYDGVSFYMKNGDIEGVSYHYYRAEEDDPPGYRTMYLSSPDPGESRLFISRFFRGYFGKCFWDMWVKYDPSEKALELRDKFLYPYADIK